MLKLLKLTVIVFLLTGLILSLFFIEIPVLVLENIITKEIIFVSRIFPQDEFSIEWMHSVELQPWEEIYKVDKEYHIILDRTKFRSFGAGVPDDIGTHMELKDGYITFFGINRKIGVPSYRISSFAKHVFCFKNAELFLYDMVEDGDIINIYVCNKNLFDYYKLKIAASKSR